MLKKIRNLILFILLFIVIIGALYTVKGYDMYKEALEKCSINEKVASIKEDENYVKIEDMSDIYVKALVSVEDHRFYKHKAVDLISIGRAIFNNVKNKELGEGGSTITQQLAKNIYFTQEAKLTRKIAEIFMAFEIENNCEKDEVLELYANTCYFGEGYYGIGEASKGYYGKEPKNLTYSESTMLAGVPNAPSVYIPTQNPELAGKRQKVVERALEKYGDDLR